MAKNTDRIEELKRQIVDLQKRWPAHSVPPALVIQMDDLEEDLRRELAKPEETSKDTGFAAKTLSLRAIGYVENEFDEPDTPMNDLDESRLILDPSLTEGLQGLEAGQKIMVVYNFHHATGFALLQHPQGNQSRVKRGVFALCSPKRPNPIGVTVVTLVGIEDNVLRVRGLDACNGSPILDIKPA